MTENAQKKKNRLQELAPRTYLGWLMDYQSINIFRI